MLELLRNYPNVKAFLPLDEEASTVGTTESDITFWSDTSFVLQADRNHYKNDFITHTNGIDCTSKEFDNAVMPYLHSYKYGFAVGTITDVGELKCMGLDVCTFNIAAGYLQAHSDQEIVDIRRLKNSYNLVCDLIDNLGNKVWEHKGVKEAKGYGGWYGYGAWEDTRVYEDGYDETPLDYPVDCIICPTCEEEVDVDLDGTIWCCNKYLHVPEEYLDGMTLQDFNGV